MEKIQSQIVDVYFAGATVPHTNQHACACVGSCDCVCSELCVPMDLSELLRQFIY